MPARHLDPTDKKQFIGAVGHELVRKHGKQKYYKLDAISVAVEAGGYSADVACWAYSIFASHEDFDAAHQAGGEAFDYTAMRAEVLSDLTPDGSFAGIDLDLSWLEWPDIDVSGLFDWFS